MSATSFPVVTVAGTPIEIGRAYGEACRERIEAAFAYYGALFRDDYGIAWAAARAMGRAALPLVERHDPVSAAEMAGIAEATGRGLDEVMALHMKTEMALLAEAPQPTARPEGCTTLAALPEATAGGHTIVAKNWDWTCGAQELGVVLRKRYAGGPAVVTLTEAGLMGRDGFNGAGIAVVANALACDQRGDGLPLHVTINGALRAPTVSRAMQAILGAPRGSAMNYLVAHRDGFAVCLEAAPVDHNVVWESDGLIVHANHFLVDNPRFRDTMVGPWPDSLLRWYRADRLLRRARGTITTATVEALLCDRFDAPNSVSLLPSGKPGATAYQTNGSIVIDLHTNELRVAYGPPEPGAYRTVGCGEVMG